MTALRLCHPHDFTQFLSYDEESNLFHGAAAHVFYEAMDLLTKGIKNQMQNFTLTYQPSRIFNFPLTNSENNEGCIDALQSNQSDMLLTLVKYPRDAVNVSEGLIVYETILMIGSAYKKTAKAETTQVLSSFNSFSPSVWLLCILTFVTLLSMLRLQTRVRDDQSPGSHRYDSLLLACHLNRLNEISNVGPTRKLIFLCASLFALVVVHYFCTLIKTELVTMKDPQVFASYKDIEDRKVMPVFFSGMSHDMQFKKNQAESHKQKLWKYAVDTFGVENLYLDINPITFALVGFAVILYREVVILDSLLMPLMPASGCMAAARNPEKILDLFKMVSGGGLMSYMKSSGFHASHIEYLQRFIKRYPDLKFDSAPTFNLFTSVDPREKSYLLGIAMNERMNVKMRRAIDKSVRRGIEAGFNLKFIEIIVAFNILKSHPLLMSVLGEKVKSMHHFQKECESCAIVRPDIEYHALTLGNFRTLFIFIAASYSVIFCIHIYLQFRATVETGVRRRSRRWGEA